MKPGQHLECPTPSILTDYVRGSLSEVESEPVNQHLETCHDCLTRLETLATPDAFLATLSHATRQPLPEISPEWIALIQEWSKLSLHSSSVARQILTHHVDPQSNTTIDVSQCLSPTELVDCLGHLGEYQVQSVLGQGGMGLVLQAYDPQLEREVALKIMLPQHPPRPDLVSRFEQEARALAAVKSDYVVQVFAVGRAETPQGIVPYLAMERLHGETLADRLLPGALPINELLDLALQMTTGLIAVHARGIIHRDIKPGNIWLEFQRSGEGVPTHQSQFGRIKLLDFGLAHLANRPTNVTRTGAQLGTPGYMAPEQIEGRPVNAQTDIFSLGAVLYEMATGKVAFCGRNVATIAAAVLKETLVDPAARNPTLPRLLTRLICKMLAKQAEDRPASAEIVWSELKAIQASLMPVPRSPQKALTKSRSVLFAVCLVGIITTWLIFQRIQVETPHGTLIIHSEDPDVAVQITQSGAVIIDRTTERQLPLKVGEYGIEFVEPNTGLTLSTHQFEITRSGRPTIKIQRVPTEKPKSVHPTPPERPARSTDKQLLREWDWAPNEPRPAISPFNGEEAAQFQQAWAKQLNLPVEWTDSLGSRFCLIPPGEFWMGSTDEEVRPLLEPFSPSSHDWQAIHSQTPRHRVILTRPFYLAAHELTQQQYLHVMGKNPARFSAEGMDRDAVTGLDTSQFAVDGASWNDMLEFCDRLNATERIVPLDAKQSNAPGTGVRRKGYRLPTEAEWEFACRAGTTTRFWSGDRDSDLAKVGWSALNAGGRVHAVGGLPANPFGLHDVHGNLWEFCMDAWSVNYFEQFRDRPAIDPAGPLTGGERRVRKGGLWFDAPSSSRSASRGQYDDWTPVINCGARLAINIEDSKSLILKMKPPR